MSPSSSQKILESVQQQIPSSRPHFDDIPAVLEDIRQVLASGRLMMGEHLERFEAGFARLAGTKYAVALNSCTTALEITLRFIGAKGGEVIIPTNTFVATVNAALFAGAQPVLTDISAQTLCLDPAQLLVHLRKETKAVILVHLAGQISPDTPAIRTICQERQIPLIEDCAHAHGARWEGQGAGALGLSGCFSFYPTKVMTTGTGGMLTTNDEQLNCFARNVRFHGREFGPQADPDKIHHLGSDWFMDEIRSVLGWHQLQSLERQQKQRSALVQRYLERLEEIQGVTPIRWDSRCQPSFYKLMVRVAQSRWVPELRRRLLEKHQIQTEQLYWPACHAQPVFQNMFRFKPDQFPVAETVLRQQLCLPLHAELTEQEVDRVAATLEMELDLLRGTC